MKHIKIRHTVDTVITYIIILAISLVFLFPILWLLLASFSRSGSLYSFDGFFPTEYSLDSFKKLWIRRCIIIRDGSATRCSLPR